MHKRTVIWGLVTLLGIFGHAYNCFFAYKFFNGPGNFHTFLFRLCILLIGIVVHEFGHFCIAKSYGAKFHGVRVSFSNFIPQISISIHCPPTMNNLEQALVETGGILTGIFACSMVLSILPKYVYLLNTLFLLTHLNLIPIKINGFCTDGYNLMQSLSVKWKKQTFISLIFILSILTAVQIINHIIF